ncbi:hypothetical protein [Lapillicoccus sp.]|uniref:hypothetical protein n=1 Tax=Lapillicoccus sp. TaxID=1909287 RepID=UPI0025FB8BAA|nr:hypothetical protein [Lapillicoccus sp.]
MRTLTRPTVLITTAALALAAGAGAAAATPPPRPAADSLVSIFPNDALTVRDPSQATGLRVNLPLPPCQKQVSECNSVTLLDQLDGFDIDPRIALRFAGPVDPSSAVAGVRVVQQGGGFSTGLDRVVYDAATSTVYAHPVDQLRPGTTYRLDFPAPQVARGIPRTTFTTMSATSGLQAMVAQLDDGSAYRAAGIPAKDRGLQIDATFPAAGTALAYTADLGTSLSTSPVPNLSSLAAGRYVFGSYLSPSWLTPAGDIPQTPTRSRGPVVTGQVRVPFVAIIPAGPVPRGGWPVAIFGHGFTRSDADVFLAAPLNASRGLATIATDVVGHGYGPRSAWQVTRGGRTVSVPAHARGIDRNGDGTIDSTEGSSTAVQPAPLAQVGSRDGLRQTVADDAALARALGGPRVLPLDGNQPTYYGQSFGGIYGTMFAGTDRSVSAFGLNVPGGPISEIARLSPSFRLLITQALGLSVPSLLNGGVDGFTESLPLAGQAPVTTPVPGALAIQQFLAENTWIERAGSPETFAPLVPHGRTLIQSAFGDQTVPNPTAGTLIRAGGLQDRTTFYRNDKTPNSMTNPHGFLLDPTFTLGYGPGQNQMSTFLASKGRIVIDPDGAAGVFEVPIADPNLLRTLNFTSP